MGAMGGAGGFPNLKKLAPAERVQKITHCGDIYRLATADGKTRTFLEHDLRFKTNASADGPEKATPALMRAGLIGDLADVIFASPDKINGA